MPLNDKNFHKGVSTVIWNHFNSLNLHMDWMRIIQTRSIEAKCDWRLNLDSKFSQCRGIETANNFTKGVTNHI